MSSTRRRNIVSKPTFQLKLTIIFMLMVTIVANLVGGLCYLLISERVQELLIHSAEQLTAPDMTMQEIANFLIPKILIAEGFSLFFVFFLSILVTHTIAGPVYRMERVAKEIGTGNLAIVTTLRPRDELKELADAFNVMTRGLAEKISAISHETLLQENLPPNERDFGRLKGLLTQFRLPDHLEQVVDDDEDYDEAAEVDDLEGEEGDRTAE